MKILSVKQVRKADAFTIENEPIKSIDLMERASLACTDWIIENYCTDKSFIVFAGIGNNGGDGLAIARMLSKNGYLVKVYLVKYSDSISTDFSINFERLKLAKSVIIETLTAEQYNLDFDELKKSIIIDAIFGSGLNRPLKGLALKVVRDVNDAKLKVIAIDIPSGLYADDNSDNDLSTVIMATTTLSLALPKLSYMFAENASLIGDFVIVSIGLNKNFIDDQESTFTYVDQGEVRRRLITRAPFSHKGTYGHSLIIAGSFGMIGAAILSCNACLRSGAGLVSAMVPICGYEIMQSSVPEVIVFAGDKQNFLSGSISFKNYSALGIGPGIGQESKTLALLIEVVENAQIPLVIDADAINLLANNKGLLKQIPENTILTPHPGEFERLVGKCKSGFERMRKQVKFSEENKVFVVLKGRHTSISTPDGLCFFNSSGNSGMATAGSGDVLTGLITGLLGQGYSPLDAAIVGVYSHGLAGDVGASEMGEQALIAGDIIKNIGRAFEILKK